MPSKTTQQSSSTSAPWSVQTPYLEDAFTSAKGLYGGGSNNIYNGQQVAQFNPNQLSTFQSMLNYAGGNNAPQTTGAAGAALTGAGTSGLTNAISTLQGFKPSGGTQSNIDAAGLYANNPNVDGMVQAAMRDANRSVSEQQLPQIARSAALTGNTNSNRRGISEGIVQRGLADATADTSANIRGGLYDRGLALAEQGRQFDNTASLDAMKAGGSLAGQAAGTGVDASSAGINQAGSLYDIAGAGGAGQQASSQAAIDDAKARSEYANNTPYDLLAKYYGIVGGNNWGGQSSGTSTTTQQPGALQYAGLGLYGASKLFPGGFALGGK
jgi:hypothetical protein